MSEDIGVKKNHTLKKLGPGLITGASNSDPSSIATFSQSGAQFGYGQLWIILFLYPLLFAVQELSGRLGRVTGKGVSALALEQYGRRTLVPLVLLMSIANVVTLGSDICAMADATHLIIACPIDLTVVLFALLIIGLEIFIPYGSYAKVLKFFALSLISYPLTLLLLNEPWLALIKSTIFPHLEGSKDFLFMVLASIGTTISPYMFIWQASEEVEESRIEGERDRGSDRARMSYRSVKDLRIDTSIGMLVSQLTFWCITAVAASVFHQKGLTNIRTAADAAQALEPLVRSFHHSGIVAESIFAAGIVGLGLLAVPVLAGSSSYAIAEAFQYKASLHLRFSQAKFFYLTITAATLIGLIIHFSGIDSMKALIYSSVINALCSVPLLLLVFLLGRSKRIMGRYRSGTISTVVVLTALAAIAAAAAAMIVDWVYN